MSHACRLGLKGNTNLVAMKTEITKPVTVPPKMYTEERVLSVFNEPFKSIVQMFQMVGLSYPSWKGVVVVVTEKVILKNTY